MARLNYGERRQKRGYVAVVRATPKNPLGTLSKFGGSAEKGSQRFSVSIVGDSYGDRRMYTFLRVARDPSEGIRSNFRNRALGTDLIAGRQADANDSVLYHSELKEALGRLLPERQRPAIRTRYSTHTPVNLSLNQWPPSDLFQDRNP